MKRSVLLVCCLALGAVVGSVLAQAPATSPATQAAAPGTGDRWPKTAQLDGATYTVYQPQLDSWDTYDMAVHAAVSVQPPGSDVEVLPLPNV